MKKFAVAKANYKWKSKNTPSRKPTTIENKKIRLRENKLQLETKKYAIAKINYKWKLKNTPSRKTTTVGNVKSAIAKTNSTWKCQICCRKSQLQLEVKKCKMAKKRAINSIEKGWETPTLQALFSYSPR